MYCPLLSFNHGLCHFYCCSSRFSIHYSCDSRVCNDGTPCEHHGKIMLGSKFRRRSRRSSTNVHGMQFLVAGQPSAIVDMGEPCIHDASCMNYVTGYSSNCVPHTIDTSLCIIFDSLCNCRVSSIHYQVFIICCLLCIV